MIPERLRKGHWDGYRKTMETGVTRYGTEVLQVPAIDKAGRSFSIAFTVALLYSADNKVSAIAAVIRDDTKRFERDRTQRKRISELESRVKETAPSPDRRISEHPADWLSRPRRITFVPATIGFETARPPALFRNRSVSVIFSGLLH